MSSPAKLPRALDPIYIGSTWVQPLHLFEADKTTPLALDGRTVTVFLNRVGLPEKAVEVVGVENAPGVVVFRDEDTADWPRGVYAVEIRMTDGADDLALAVSEVTVAKGAACQGDDRVGAARSPTVPGVAVGGAAPIAIALSPRGLKGDSPTDQELVALIDPLLTEAVAQIEATVRGVLIAGAQETADTTPTLTGWVYGFGSANAGATVSLFIDDGLIGTVTTDSLGTWSFDLAPLSGGTRRAYAQVNVNGLIYTSPILSFRVYGHVEDGPVPTTSPAISGTASVGSVLTCAPAVWVGTAPITVTRQWKRDDAPIAGATGLTYTTVSADDGHAIACTETATSPVRTTRIWTNQIMVGVRAATVTAFAYEAEAAALFAARISAGAADLTTRQKMRCNRLIKRLKAAGAWAKMARVYGFKDANQAASLLNWTTPGTNGLTIAGAPIFTPNVGWSGWTTANYLDTGLLASALTLNSLSMGAFTREASSSTANVMGAFGSSNGITIAPRGASQRIGSAASLTSSSAFLSGDGFQGVARTDAANAQMWRNGVKIVDGALVSTALPAVTITIGKANGITLGSSPFTISFAFIASSALSDAEWLELSAAVREYEEDATYGDLEIYDPGVGASTVTTDLVVYGFTLGGLLAAYQAHRQGKSVAVVGGFREWQIGGMSTGGLGYTDFDNKAGLGGLGRLLLTRINALEGRADTTFSFQPNMMSRVVHGLFDPSRSDGRDVVFHRSTGLARVEKTGAAISALTTRDGRRFVGTRFIDASYESDLSAMAGVAFCEGREITGVGNEVLNGWRGTTTDDHGDDPQFRIQSTGQLVNVDPWVQPGNPASGLLWGVELDPGLLVGTSDNRRQAFNFRLTACTNARRRAPFGTTPPPGYVESNYEVLLRGLALTPSNSFAGGLVITNSLPNDAFDINSGATGMSTDMVGGSVDWCEAGYDVREDRQKTIENYIRGLFYLLQYSADARIPSQIRTSALAYGLHQEHYFRRHPNDAVFWPTQVYVREGRRMVTDLTWAADDIAAADGTVPRSQKTIGTASYAMDSHVTSRIAVEYAPGRWKVWNEGNFFRTMGGNDLIAPIPYEGITPRRGECTNLLVLFGLSSTHTAFGSQRMEFTNAQLGQSAGAAAAISLNAGVAFQDVDYPALRAALLASPALSGEVAPVLPQLN